MRTICIGLLAVTVLVSAPAKKKKAPANKPGVFDYYVLSLSWSPEHCASHNDSPQCDQGRRFAFIVHGLWPQFERGYPQNCPGSSQVPETVAKQAMQIMPSRQLIRHEWTKHGTCSGLGVKEYFQKLEDAYVLVKIPQDFKQPLKRVQTTAADLKRKFVRDNPGFDQSFAVLCGGQYIREVRVCYTKDLKPRPCSTEVRDQCRSGTVILRPVR
jgi:ribonuclease T2